MNDGKGNHEGKVLKKVMTKDDEVNESPLDLTNAKVFFIISNESGALWKKEAKITNGEASIVSVPKKYEKYGNRWQYQMHTQDGNIHLLKYGSYPKTVERLAK